jgi:hypothetical protein
MPGFDRTGPRGLGPMTGGGMGICVEQGQYGRPRFWGFGGFGRGWRNRYFATGMPGRTWGRGFHLYEPDISPKDEVEMLQEEANYFERALKNIREQIDKLKNSDSEEQK